MLASADGAGKADEAAQNDVVYTDGVLSVDFAENIEVIPTRQVMPMLFRLMKLMSL